MILDGCPSPDAAPARRKPRSRLTAEQWWQKAREAGWAGRPAAAVHACERALQQPGAADSELRGRIYLTLAYQLSELGDLSHAMAALDSAEDAGASHITMARSMRGVLLAKVGQHGRALDEFMKALTELGDVESLDLAATLLNRGTLHMNAGRLTEARADTERAYRVSRANKYDAMEFMAQHNLGYIEYLGGNLPQALDLMARASRRAPSAAMGVPALDRARVLTASGMFSEAQESVDRALHTFIAQHAQNDLVDALLASGELALLRGDQIGARRQARKAETISKRRSHQAAALVARLLALRADAVAFDPVRSTRITPPTKAILRAAVKQATTLAAELDAAGLGDDARTARLVLAEAQLLSGDVKAAAAAAARAGASGRTPALNIRMHAQLVDARIALSSGRHEEALKAIAHGLDDLAQFQTRFGSQDMQAAAAVHGGALARTGLRTAVDTGEPRVILPWLERSRAATTRLPAIRPPNDPELVESLAQLRMSIKTARDATLAGRPDPVLQKEITESRARIRAKTWTTGGVRGRPHRPITLTAVQRHLRQREPDTTVLAFFHGQGKIHALVVTARRADYRVLGERATVERRLSRVGADLDMLAAPRIGLPVRTVAARSLRSGLMSLSQQLVEPIEDLLGPGKIRLAVVGRLGTAPWGLIPGLAGRPISVTPSVTSALAAPEVTTPAHQLGVLAVAGPDVRGGEAEVRAVGERHAGSVVLTGVEATGDAVLARIPPGGLLHIAAHGHHVPESPMFSAVLLADGPLFGYDIAPNPALPDHVVLSSCDVGQSADRPGGEPLGLAAALLRSGVRTVIAGVSRISDSVAATVMTAYHDRLIAGADPASALAAALDAAGDDPAPLTCFGA